MTDKKKSNTLSTTISGLIAGSLSKFITHPLDTIKSKLQIDKTEFVRIREIAKLTYMSEGIKGFYKGINITIIGSIPAVGLYFGSYEFMKGLLYRKGIISNDFLNHFISGLYAEAVSCIIFVPVDIIRERLQVQSNLKDFSYKNDFDALRTIIKTEGLRGIYKAYWATLASFGPTSALYFMFFEYFKGKFILNSKDSYIKEHNYKDIIVLTFSQSVFCSLLASSLSSFLTSPLDLVKFRMQISRRKGISTDKPSYAYRNLCHGLKCVVQQEGFLCLFRGSYARVLSMTPQGTIIMTIVEQVRPIVTRYLNDEV